jgi:hypothetical protein
MNRVDQTNEDRLSGQTVAPTSPAALSSIGRLRRYHHFTLWEPKIGGVKFGSTIGKYLSDHFAQGAQARPRSYFYPDEPTFTGPRPIQALYYMVRRLIAVAQAIDKITR